MQTGGFRTVEILLDISRRCYICRFALLDLEASSKLWQRISRTLRGVQITHKLQTLILLSGVGDGAVEE